MPRRRASPKVEGKSGRSKLAQAASAAGPYDGESNFPIDDLPPDDLPVRDIAEDQEEWRPAHSMAIRAADLAGRDLADPVHVPNTDSPEPRTTLSGSGQPTSSAALRPEPAVETSAPDPQPEADPSTLQAQYLLPGFGSGNSVEAQLDPGGKQAMRPRRPRGSTTKRALSFAQRPEIPRPEGRERYASASHALVSEQVSGPSAGRQPSRDLGDWHADRSIYQGKPMGYLYHAAGHW